jgi:hypothetical protein
MASGIDDKVVILGMGRGALARERALLLLLLVAGVLAAASAHAGTREIGPGTDWCAALRTLAPGDELVLQPGEYPGGCGIARGGTPGAPIVVRARDPGNRPRIVYDGQDTNVVNLRAGHVTIRGLQFGPTRPGVDAIRVYRGDGVTVEDCRFIELGGIAVAATHESVRRLTIRGNEIRRSRSTALYVGCHEGECAATDVLIEGNYIDGVDIPAPSVGYGMQVKLGSTAWIRDNVVIETKGPGIMVYGARDPVAVSVVERNLTARSAQSSGIVVGGGPAIVRNNIAVANAEAGIALENYGRRGLLRGVLVLHNTIWANAGAGIALPGTGPLEARVINNLVHGRPGTPALPAARAGFLGLGNVECRTQFCFANAEGGDFSPVVTGNGRATGDLGTASDDYFSRPRATPPTAGALEGPGRPILRGFK